MHANRYRYRDRWLCFPAPRDDAVLRLFCLPYAGGGSAIFHAWPAGLPGIEVAAVRLPGRESRFREAPYTRSPELVKDLVQALLPHLDRPYALFGHSMGGRLAFEVVRRLRREGVAEPVRLFVSGSRAPHLPVRPPTHHLPKNEFLEYLREMGGAPPEFFQSSELVGLLLPALRADFSVVDTYVYQEEPALRTSISAFCGTNDSEVPLSDAAAWRHQTVGGFVLHTLPGDHFFIHTRTAELLAIIRADLIRIHE